MDTEQEDFWEWKNKLLLDDVSKEQRNKTIMRGEKTVMDLMKSLGLKKDVRKFLMPKDTKMSWNLPIPQTLKEIQKWRDVEEAHKRLEEARTRLAVRLEDIGGRWRTVEEGQRMLKQNLVKYNAFVKEKKGKVADNISKRMGEKRRQVERSKTIKM